MLGGDRANLCRLLLATGLLALWAHGFGGGLSGPVLGWFLLSGMVGFGMGDLALYQAFPRLGPRLTVLMAQCLAAPFAALIEWIWLGTSLSLLQGLCAGTILAGIAIALMPERGQGMPPPTRRWGLFFGLLAAVGQGGGAVLSRKAFGVLESMGISIDGGTAAYQRILGGVGLTLVVTVMVSRWHGLRRAFRGGAGMIARERSGAGVWRRALPWILGNSVAGPVLGVACYQWALANYPTGVVLPIVATTPLVVIPLERWAGGERAGGRAVLGGVMAVLGAAVLTWKN
jgi:drug/metabolite transporter (DMT)-like permease